MSEKLETLTENRGWSFNSGNSRHKSSGFSKNRRRQFEHYRKCTQASNLAFLKSQIEGFTINFCCGRDPNGDVKVDVDGVMLRSQKQSCFDSADYVIADVRFPPFVDGCCVTLIVDPPFSLFSRFKWILNLSRLASCKVVVSHCNTNLKLPAFSRELYFTESKGIFLRLWWVFTRKEAGCDVV